MLPSKNPSIDAAADAAAVAVASDDDDAAAAGLVDNVMWWSHPLDGGHSNLKPFTSQALSSDYID